MRNHDFRDMFLAAGVPEDQIEDVLEYFRAFGGAAKIISVTDYEISLSSRAVMEERLDADDVHSPAARYLIALVERIADWEDQAS